MENNYLQGEAPQPSQPQPIPQPIPQPQPIPPQPQPNLEGDDLATKADKQKSIINIIIIAITAIVAIVIIIIVAIVLLGGNNDNSVNGVLPEDVRNYCQNAGLEINSDVSDYEELTEYVICLSKTDDDSQKMMIIYQYYEKPIMEYGEGIVDSSISNMSSEKMEIIEKSDYYIKAYVKPAYANGTVQYEIVDGRSCIYLIALNNDVAKSALIAIGYADSNWPEIETQQNVESLQKDTMRRNDLSHVDTSLVQYQTNNSNKSINLPIGPSYWKGALEIECEENNIACEFVRDYLNNRINASQKSNDFIDPDGTPYSLYVTENWVDNGSITPTFGNTNSYLVAIDEGYTIGGNSPFSEHIIYIIPSGRCDDGAKSVVKATKRHFAIMYMLEEAGIYCIDDQ